MKAWCHLTTIFKQRQVLQIAGLLALCVALTTTLFFSVISRAAPGVNQIIGFQGRLLDANGNVVPDGSYNVQFKIYEGGTGTAAGNPGGELVWTETYINNGSPTGAVAVKNGLLSVNLGSLNPFGNSIDWDNDTIWLSMNVAGRSAACTTFGAGACDDDGEMLPMKRLTSSPYAMNAGAVNGKTADNFVQLAQGVQTDASSNTSSIFINKTGTGNLIQLQNTATDVFTVTNSGSIAFGNSSDHNISINTSGANTGGRQLAISAGDGGSGTGSSGGDLVLQGGAAGGTNGNGGNVQIDAGAKTGTGTGGAIAIGSTNAGSITIGSTNVASTQTIDIGTNNTVGSTSNVTIGSGGSADGGTTVIQAKNAVTINTNGTTRATFSDTTNSVYFGNGVTAAAPDDYTLQGTGSSTTAVAGGSLNIQGGAATVGDANGGNVVIAGGAGVGTGTSGLVVLTTPTFSTVMNDVNCYADGALVATSCSISNSSVNNSAAVLVGFSAAGQTATLPDPIITTAGRVIYIMAAGNSETFTLAVNGGGANNEFTLRANATATMIWNGSDWTVAGGAPSAAPQGYTSNATNVQIGNGVDDETTTLLTLDKAATAPTITDEALLGSMYYDTTLGKLQCYEASGWGACSSSPDNFVTLSPEYSNAVTNGTGIGSMTSDLCSDALNINNGTSAQPTVCGANETYNFYNWTSAEATDQTKSIYVTYQLPTSFKEFASGSTSLVGRTDGTNASVSYEIFRNSTSGLTACGPAVQVTTTNNTWTKMTPEEADPASVDPSDCGFAAGDSIVFKINMTAKNDANAYVSNLGFVFSNQ